MQTNEIHTELCAHAAFNSASAPAIERHVAPRQPVHRRPLGNLREIKKSSEIPIKNPTLTPANAVFDLRRARAQPLQPRFSSRERLSMQPPQKRENKSLDTKRQTRIIPDAVTRRTGKHPFPFRTRQLSPSGRW